MSRFKGLAVAIFVATAFFTHSASAGSSEVYPEVNIFYNSFTPNVGGISMLGARFRSIHIEGTVASVSNALGLELGYLIQFNEDGIFNPHLALGLQYWGGWIGPTPGVGFNVKIIPLFGGHLGLGFDAYNAFFLSNAHVLTLSLYNLFLSYTFY